MPIQFSVAEFDPADFHRQAAQVVSQWTAAKGRYPEMHLLSGHNHLSPALSIGSERLEVERMRREANRAALAGKSISIADHLTLGDPASPEYRPTVHYAYHPCDDALLSLHELAGRNWRQQDAARVLKDEIVSGTDELGVLLMGHARGAYWYGSQIDIHEARKLVPYNNATSIQVCAPVLSGIIWAIENPERGIVEADETFIGVEPGDRINACGANSLEYCTLAFAAMRAGAIVAPLKGMLRSLSVVPAPGHEAHRPEDIAPYADLPVMAFGDVAAALKALPPEGDVLIAASLYLAGALLRLNREFPD